MNIDIKITRQRQAIIDAGLVLVKNKLITGTWGNISCRTHLENVFAITPSGSNYAILKPEDIPIIDGAGTVIDDFNPQSIPSSEMPLHLAIYRARPDIKAVVHTHSIYASACAVVRKTIPAIIEDMVQVVGGEIAISKYALAGTEELGEEAVKSLETRNAVLLANHGVVACGHSIKEAMLCAELVEKAAQIYILAQGLGGAVPLDDNDVTLMREFYQKYYRERQGI